MSQNKSVDLVDEANSTGNRSNRSGKGSRIARRALMASFQCAVILGCLALGEIISNLFSLPVPSSILGLLILTLLLECKVVRLSWVAGISNLLIRYMGLFFVPPGVALMVYYKLIAGEWVPILVATAVSMVIVLAATAATHELIHRFSTRRQKRNGKID